MRWRRFPRKEALRPDGFEARGGVCPHRLGNGSPEEPIDDEAGKQQQPGIPVGAEERKRAPPVLATNAACLPGEVQCKGRQPREGRRTCTRNDQGKEGGDNRREVKQADAAPKRRAVEPIPTMASSSMSCSA